MGPPVSGATVIVIDLDDYRLNKSIEFGSDYANKQQLLRRRSEIKMDKRKGSRLCIESSGASAALHEAIRSVAYNGKVVASGFYQGDAIGLRLGEEFHHNRVQFLCSQIQAVSPEISYRWDRLRMEQTIMQLQGSGKLHLMPLITHQYAFEEAAKAYELLDRQTEEHLQVVLTFTDK